MNLNGVRMTEAERKFHFLKRCIAKRCQARDAKSPARFSSCKQAPRPHHKAGGTLKPRRKFKYRFLKKRVLVASCSLVQSAAAKVE